jgi:predicted secreted protein
MSALKVLAFFVSLWLVVFVALPWAVPRLAENEFMQDADIDRLVESLDSLDAQMESKRESWRSLVDAVRPQ